MVDIAAQLSLTVSGPAIDPAAILGAETADNQAFGDILAGQVAGNLGATPGTGAPASPLPPFPTPAGNRQPGGKILPGAAQILPDAAPVGVEAPAAQALPGRAAPAATEPETPAAKATEASPVHALIKMMTAALKGQHPIADEAQAAQDAQTDPETAGSDGDAPEPAASVPTALPFALPIMAIPAVATPAVAATRAGLPQAAAAQTPSDDRTTILVRTPAEEIDAALQTTPLQVRPRQVQAAQTLPTPADAQPRASAQAPGFPVLTVAAAAVAAPMGVVTLASAPALPAGQTVTARIEVAPAARTIAPTTADHIPAAQPQLAGRDTAIETPGAAASRVAPAVRSVLAERTATDFTAAPATNDAQPALAAAAPALAAAPAPTVPVVQMPRQDFAALVDRLVEARNAAAPQSTHASLVHAEFGQVSLHFQQDGGDLKVAMSSADPDFARAAQAAQAAMPAERPNPNADANSRGQSQPQAQTQSQTQAQTSGNGSHSHREAAGAGTDRSDQHGRGNQGRHPRGSNNSSNPSPRWAGRDQAQTRGGIFA